MPQLLNDLLRALFGSFVGTIGFAMLVHVPKRSSLLCGCVASLSYLIYWGLTCLKVSDPLSIFAGAFFGCLISLLCARKMKIIGTVFLMSSIVPVVPGLGLCRMMAFLGQGQIAAGADMGIRAMITIAMIALGLGAGSVADRVLWSRSVKKHHI